jgi:transcriptional regulator with GAF, ATPase, and Fis domain
VNPRLVATAGVTKGTVWAVNDGLTLGRDSSNQLEVRDPAVSRRHCAVSKVGRGLFELADGDSHNGTFVNGAKVSRKVIQHGDRIRIGSSEYVFLTGADESSVAAAAGSKDDTSGLRTISLSRLGPPADAPWVGRMARDLSAFFKIANVINSTHDVLQSVGNEEGSALHLWHRKGVAEEDIRIREELVQQATWEQCAILSSSPSEHILCVPLLAVERVLGVIYLTASAAPFVEEHAFFLSSVARIAAVTLENVSRVESLEAENQRLLVEVKAEHTLIGESRPMQRVNEFVRRVARGDTTVLIRGESGTGKELVARAVHANGLRPQKPFVAINCAAIPEALLESELFGHEKGAFTGAAGLRKGKFEAAEDGTLFLDEIGEMAPLLQAKLLRVLQQREFERLGGNRLIPFNARVVAATNKNLEQAIKAGEFRQDLYYRLNVVSILLPPLREHRDDIPALALYFANKYAARSKRRFKGIAAEARSLLMRYSWPGNVRELENAIEHAIVMGLTDEILPEDLPNALLEEQSAELAGRYHNTLNQTKKQLVLTALDEAKGSPVEAARRLGIHPKYLHRLIRNLNLQGETKRL